MGIPAHLTCLLRNLYAGQEATVRSEQQQLEHGTKTGSKLGKEYVNAVYCCPAYLTSMQNTSCEILGWMNHKLKSRLPGEISTTSDDTTLMAESEEELKCLLMKVKVESDNVGLKLNIQKTNIMASSSITSWQIDVKQWKQCQTLFWGVPKSLQMVTAAMKLKDAYFLEEKL